MVYSVPFNNCVAYCTRGASIGHDGCTSNTYTVCKIISTCIKKFFMQLFSVFNWPPILCGVWMN